MARKTYKIEVTPLDIEKAERNNSYQCVVAQAIARSVPDAHHILVDLRTIRFSLSDRRLQYLTPATVSQYVVDFDAGDELGPFRFSLSRPRVTRRKVPVDPAAPRAKNGSPEHKAKKGRRHPRGETFDLVGADGSVTKEEVMPYTRTLPLTFRANKTRMYGDRRLRINRDRFAQEAAETEATT
jgi:hypothetical protein